MAGNETGISIWKECIISIEARLTVWSCYANISIFIPIETNYFWENYNDNDLKFAYLGQIVGLDFPLYIVSSWLSHRGSVNLRNFPRLAITQKGLLNTAKNYEFSLVFDGWSNGATLLLLFNNIEQYFVPESTRNQVQQCWTMLLTARNNVAPTNLLHPVLNRI